MFLLMIYNFLFSLLTCLIITSQIKKLKILRKGEISLLGGVAIWFSFLFVFLFISILNRQYFLLNKEILGIFVCSILIFLTGIIDDRIELSVPKKFIAQLFVAFIVIIFGVRTQIVGIGLLGNIIITLFWILGITNTFNHLDIVDGLSSGVALISALTLFLFSIITSNILVALVLAALIGSTLGFLRYNFPIAKIYMGNSGSHFLGFVLGTLAIMISYATLEKRLALIAPLLIFGFPIFDTIFVVWVRLLKHKSIWTKSNDHLALRFIALGFSKKKTIFYTYLISILFCVTAILILLLTNRLGFFLLFLLFAICIFIALRMQKVKMYG